MREACGNGQNDSGQTDDSENIEDRLAADIGKLGLVSPRRSTIWVLVSARRPVNSALVAD
jgi:hypothetical protein